MKRKLMLLLLIILLLSYGVPNVFVTHAYYYRDYYPTKDAYVSTKYPNTNYGGNALLWVGEVNADPQDMAWTYLCFDYTGIDRNRIEAAHLHLHVSYEVDVNVSVYNCIDDDWTENSITWNTQPVYGGWFADAVLDYGWNVIDVTNTVVQEDDNIITFRILNTTKNGAPIDSKEGTYKPFLELALTYNPGGGGGGSGGGGSGNWTKIEQTGWWAQCDLAHWEVWGWNEGNVTWQITVNNFTGYSLRWNFSEFEIWREWWQYYTNKDVYVRLKISDGENSTLFLYLFNGWTNVFGAIRGVNIYYGVNETVTSWKDLTPRMLLDTDIESVKTDCRISIDAQNKQVQFVLYWRKLYNATGPDYAGTTVPFLNNFYGKTVTIQLNFYHGGQGKVIYNLENEAFGYAVPPPFEDVVLSREEVYAWWDSILYTIGQLFGSWWAYLVFAGQFVFSIVSHTLPYFPLILLFWFLDAVLTSITTGNLQPIGTCIMTIYDFLRGVIQTIVNIASFVRDLIEFW